LVAVTSFDANGRVPQFKKFIQMEKKRERES
jgi:hypothetical protein